MYCDWLLGCVSLRFDGQSTAIKVGAATVAVYDGGDGTIVFVCSFTIPHERGYCGVIESDNPGPPAYPVPLTALPANGIPFGDGYSNGVARWQRD